MTNDLKSLQVRKTKLEREIKELEREKNEVCQRLNEKKKQLSNVNSGIKQLQSNVVITEHILVRYLERVKGIDMEEIKKEILEPAEISTTLSIPLICLNSSIDVSSSLGSISPS